MRGMKLPQFSTRSLLLAPVFVAIQLAASIGWWRVMAFQTSRDPVVWSVLSLVGLMPLWLPFAFIAYAIGRKSFPAWLVIVFAITQPLAIGLAYAAVANLMNPS
jgi:hypothetical protein